MKVKIANHRWGNHQPGETVDVTEGEGRWLVGIGRATADGLSSPVNSQRVHEGGNGADPLAGGDPTRLYGMTAPSAERQDNGALPVPGSPVQYNWGVAEDNGQENTGRPDAKARAREAAAGGRPAAPASGSDRPAASENQQPPASGKQRATNARKGKD